MKYKDYSTDIWNRIHTTLDQVLKADSAPIAAFDADGTLWDTDLGENFFHYQIDNKLISLPKNAWEHYEELKAQDPKVAFLWLAQINQGRSLEEVQNWAVAALKSHHPVPIFEEQKKIVDLFLSKGVQVFVVTASIKWAVEPGARNFMGLPFESVIGVETESPNGVVSEKQKGIISYRQGKVEALLAKTGGKKPFFASGNTMGDYQLMQAATHLSLAVSAASRDDKLFKTEFELQEKAVEHGWLAHRFI